MCVRAQNCSCMGGVFRHRRVPYRAQPPKRAERQNEAIETVSTSHSKRVAVVADTDLKSCRALAGFKGPRFSTVSIQGLSGGLQAARGTRASVHQRGEDYHFTVRKHFVSATPLSYFSRPAGAQCRSRRLKIVSRCGKGVTSSSVVDDKMPILDGDNRQNWNSTAPEALNGSH
jgi:hypothetical protein